MRNTVLAAAFGAATVMPVWAGSGDLDTGFDLDGHLTLTGMSQSRVIALTNTGVSTVAGTCSPHFCIARYLSSGSVDTSFGAGGKIEIDLSAHDNAQGFAAFATSDDKYWVLANRASAGQRLSIARVTASNGALDTTFDGDGIADLDLNGFDIRGEQAHMDAAGRIYIVGFARVYETDAHDSIFVARVTSAGVLDPVFYGAGKNFLSLTADGTVFAPTLDQSLLTPNGKLVLSGHSSSLSHNLGFVLRINYTGGYDTSFNSTGIRQIALANAQVTTTRVDVKSDERILAVSDVETDDSVKKTAIHLFKSDGALDTDYSTDGIDITQLNNAALHQHSVTWMPEGRLVVAGWNDSNQLVLTRVAADGVVGDQWTVPGIVDLNRLIVMGSGNWLLAQAQQLSRLQGDDRHPDTFTLATKLDQPVNSTVVSDSVKIAGLEQVAQVSFVGNAAFGVSTTNSCVSVTTFVAAGTVKNDDYLCVKMTTAETYETETKITVNVGDYSTDFVNKTGVKPSDDGGGGSGALWPFGLLFVAALRVFNKRQR